MTRTFNLETPSTGDPPQQNMWDVELECMNPECKLGEPEGAKYKTPKLPAATTSTQRSEVNNGQCSLDRGQS